jgi:hypothetical protein
MGKEKCRYFVHTDDGCPNLDGSFENTDICPLDGEGCISGLGPENLEERTLFPTRITGTYSEVEKLKALDWVQEAMGKKALTQLAKTELSQIVETKQNLEVS